MQKWVARSSLASKTSRTLFVALNDDGSPQDRRTEPNLVWLEPSGHEDPEYIRKVSSMPVHDMAMQNVWSTSLKVYGMKEAFVSCQGFWQVRRLPGHRRWQEITVKILCYFAKKIKVPGKWIMSVWQTSGSQPLRNMYSSIHTLWGLGLIFFCTPRACAGSDHF